MNKLCLLIGQIGPDKWLIYENVKNFQSLDGVISFEYAGKVFESNLPYVMEYKKVTKE